MYSILKILVSLKLIFILMIICSGISIRILESGNAVHPSPETFPVEQDFRVPADNVMEASSLSATCINQPCSISDLRLYVEL